MGLICRGGKQREGAEDVASPLAALRSEVDRLFDSFVREPFGSLDRRFGSQRGWSPPVDVAENDEQVTVRAEVPGVGPEDLEVTVSGGQLVLAGEKKAATEEGQADYFHTETRYGAFRRSVPLPEAVDPQRVEAEYAHGVLTVRLKKSPSSPPKRIEVSVKRPSAEAGA